MDTLTLLDTTAPILNLGAIFGEYASNGIVKEDFQGIPITVSSVL